MKGAIVIGASAGIGREVALELSRRGWRLGLAARRLELLRSLQTECPGETFIERIDVKRPLDARGRLDGLIRAMGGVELIVISAGVIFHDPGWEEEIETVSVNAAGFAAMFRIAFDYFRERGGGQIAGLSSVAAVRGGHGSPVYNATKAFVASLMHGYRIRAWRLGLPLVITDIRPGHVATGMLEGQRGAFWVIPTPEAARGIVRAILGKRKHAYITRRWWAVAWAMRLLPDAIYGRFES